MARYGPQFGPDFTFLGVPECDLDDESSYADADVVILGAPFDGGTSYRAGTRFGPQAIRMTDYLPHDGSRPSWRCIPAISKSPFRRSRLRLRRLPGLVRYRSLWAGTIRSPTPMPRAAPTSSERVAYP